MGKKRTKNKRPCTSPQDDLGSTKKRLFSDAVTRGEASSPQSGPEPLPQKVSESSRFIRAGGGEPLQDEWHRQESRCQTKKDRRLNRQREARQQKQLSRVDDHQQQQQRRSSLSQRTPQQDQHGQQQQQDRTRQQAQTQGRPPQQQKQLGSRQRAPKPRPARKGPKAVLVRVRPASTYIETYRLLLTKGRETLVGVKGGKKTRSWTRPVGIGEDGQRRLAGEDHKREAREGPVGLHSVARSDDPRTEGSGPHG